MKASQVRFLLHWGLCLACTAGFVWLSMDQMKKFVEGSTNVRSTWRQPKEVDGFPNIVFCPRNPFLSLMDSYGTKEEIEAAQDLSMVIEYASSNLKNASSFSSSDRFERFLTNTEYHGRCEVWRLLGGVLPNREYHEFRTNFTGDMIMFFLMNGEEFFFTWNYFTYRIPMIEVSQTSMVHIIRSMYVLLEGHNGGCSGKAG